jgi:poly-gamma-glutamate synthesis protein (capsule biosynthesis protein)
MQTMPCPMSPLTLLLTGDVMTGRGIDQILPQPVDPALHEPWVHDARDYVRLAEAAHGAVPRGVALAYPWGEALAEIEARAPRWRIVNLETALTARGTRWPGKGIHYRMAPAHLGLLQAARIDACVLANNHVLDWGADGLADTLQALRGAGIAAVGAGEDETRAWQPATWPLDPPEPASAGGPVHPAQIGNAPPSPRLRLFACATRDSGVPAAWAAGPGRPGVALLPRLDDAAAQHLAAIARADRRPGDVTVWSLHWGDNWVAQVPAAQRRFARALIDLGAADLVHGHSSHHPLPLELHRGRLVLHGCGDLINDYEGIAPGPQPRRQGMGLRGDLNGLYFATLAPDGHLRALEVVPMQLRRLRLQPADAAARADFARLLGGQLHDTGRALRLLNGLADPPAQDPVDATGSVPRPGAPVLRSPRHQGALK